MVKFNDPPKVEFEEAKLTPEQVEVLRVMQAEVLQLIMRAGEKLGMPRPQAAMLACNTALVPIISGITAVAGNLKPDPNAVRAMIKDIVERVVNG